MIFEKVYLQTGSNVGDRKKYLNAALRALLEREEIKNLRASSIIETEPWGNTNQGHFLNQVLEFDYSGSPQELLLLIRKIESENDRRRDGQRNMPRTLDLDILFFGRQIIQTNDLEIPHPRLHLRRFVLEPLSELAPEWKHPVTNMSVTEMLQQLSTT